MAFKNITEFYLAEAQHKSNQADKYGDYTGNTCPNCDRKRIVIGTDKKRRCDKCGWCIEDNAIDIQFLEWLTT